MANITVTDVNQNLVIGHFDPKYANDTLLVPDAKIYPRGTILARSTATDNLVIYVKGGVVAGNGIPKAILARDLDTTAGAGNFQVNPLISGRIYFTRAVIDADGDNSNIDQVVTDELRDYGIIIEGNRDLSILEA